MAQNICMLILTWPVLQPHASRVRSLSVDGPWQGTCVNANYAASKRMAQIQGIGRSTAWNIVRARTCPYTDAAEFKERITAIPEHVVFWQFIEKVLLEGKLCVGCDTGKHSPVTDVNVASYTRLTSIEGIGNGLAMLIIRGRSCSFEDEEDLKLRFEALQDNKAHWETVQDALNKRKLCVGREARRERFQGTGRSPGNVSKGSGAAGVATTTLVPPDSEEELIPAVIEELDEVIGLGNDEDAAELATEFGGYDFALPGTCRALWRECEVIVGERSASVQGNYGDCRSFTNNLPVDDFECELLLANIEKAKLRDLERAQKAAWAGKHDFRYREEAQLRAASRAQQATGPRARNRKFNL